MKAVIVSLSPVQYSFLRDILITQLRRSSDPAADVIVQWMNIVTEDTVTLEELTTVILDAGARDGV